ncbi:MAG: nuclear transport factor 2 family protein [Steroidobacteraceae bacterium]
MSIGMVRELYAAFARRDIQAMLARLAPDVVWSEPENPFNPAAGTHRGHQGFLEWVQIGREAEDIEVLEPQQFLADRDTVAVVGHMRCRARQTGRIYESDFVHVVTLRDGKIVRFQEFFDTYAAGEAFRDTT